MNCGTCKHWEKPDPEAWYGIRRIVGHCNRIKMHDEATEWSRNDNDDSQSSAMYKLKDGELAFVEDGSSYKADLFSLPEFGCVLWEKL
jgi:hypothetical protein